MSMKSLLITGALAAASLSIASAKSGKSYDIVLSSPTQVANVQLKAGEYKMTMDGSNAVFTDVDSGKKFTAPAKLETGNRKYDVTAIETEKKADAEHMQAIELGGSSNKVEFSETE